ncbi:MAG: hypothetical protein V7K48_02035 [Nostoc sp.]|uniref:hypothetical protein n=1 Tax=Nostoc sp. TaxID=1180 RepID=UPI002FF47C7D
MPTQFLGSAENLADAVPLQLNCAWLNVSLIEVFIFLAFIKLRKPYRFNTFSSDVKESPTKTTNKQ